jgi:4-hydroxy-3-methylbut-2-en-1-yl diphosphate reductase
MKDLCVAKRLKIIRAEHLGMCFGVRDAIALAEAKAKEQPITILGDLVHNESILADLRRQGVQVETDPARVKTPVAMVTAHGASEQAIARARAHGLELFEGTCPLVHYAHRSVSQLVAAGFHPVIIGKRDHVEVRGLTEDLISFDVIENEADISRMEERPRFGVASQTTQPIQRVHELVNALRRRFPSAEVRFVDTVCQPTKQRQRAAQELAGKCDVVIVIGGAHSNNTRELVNTCSNFCSRVHHVRQPEDLQPSWFDEADTIGITAGTSSPDYLIDAIESAIRRLT